MNETITSFPEMDETEKDLDNIFEEITLTLSKKLVKLEKVLAYYQAKVDKLDNQRNKIIFMLDTNKSSSSELSTYKVTPTPTIVEPSNIKHEEVLFVSPPIMEDNVDDNKEDQVEVFDEETRKVSYSDLDETEIADLVEKYFIKFNKKASLLKLRDWIRPQIDYKLRAKVDLFYLLEIVAKRRNLYRKTVGGDYEYIKKSEKNKPETILPMTKIVEFYFRHIRRISSFTDLTRWIRENYPERATSKSLESARSYLHNKKHIFNIVGRSWYKYVPEVPNEQYLYPSEEVNESNSWKLTLNSAIQYYFENIARCSHVNDVQRWIIKNTQFETVKRSTVQATLSARKNLYEYLGESTYQYIPFVAKPYQNEISSSYPNEEQLENNQ